jgi:DNA-binding NtrC family response regulator
MKPKILIVDDEVRMCRSLQILLSEEGKYDVAYALSGEEALEIIRSEGADLVIADLSMPEMSGMELLKRVKSQNPRQKVVIMTAYSSVKSAIEAMKEGAFEYLIKPFGNEEFVSVVRRALEDTTAFTQRPSKGEVPPRRRILGKSPRMNEVLATIDKAASADSNVLILGESGTGKELAAREIHERGRRSRNPFVPINCAAVPDTLLESELFGYEKGAFTGALKTRVGKFERANGGTVFLDEIGEMSPALQAKILRFIQEREFERVGGTTPIKVDVRIIAATNRNIKDDLERRNFREDLYYRLSVITIELPPLRERKEDIPLLVESFLEVKGRLLGKKITGVSNHAWNLLLRYDYPGNVRELENIIERALIEAEGDTLQASDLQLPGQRIEPPHPDDELAQTCLWEILRWFMGMEEWHIKGSWVKKDRLLQTIKQELESRLIKRAITENPGLSNSEIAEILGTTRRILELRLKELGLDKGRLSRS